MCVSLYACSFVRVFKLYLHLCACAKSSGNWFFLPPLPFVVYIIETNTNKVQKLSDYGDLRLPQNERG